MVTVTKAVLAGGPAEVTEGPVVTGLDDKVKVPFASGYEHFAHNGEFLMVEGESRPVFRWCGRTKIAE